MSQEIIEGYRLSPQQRRLWLLGQSDHSAQCAVRIDGELKIEVLEDAIRQVVSQHESLRTTFKFLHGMTIPVQVISDHQDVAFIKHDLREFGIEEQDLRIEALFVAAGERKISYDRSGLFQCHLISRSAKKHVLIISLPLAWADGPSLDCLIRQIAAAYTASSQPGKPWIIEAMQYADFAEWQNELLEAEGRLASQYWKQQYLTETDVQKLSFEKHTLLKEAFQPVTLPFEISAAAVDRMKAIVNRGDASVSSFALACWQILLSRVTDYSSIVVGVAFDGRKFTELEDAIGLFSTYVPLRGELPVNLSFEDLLEQTGAQ